MEHVQEAFALSDDEAAAAPNGYIVKLKGGGSTYNVYVHRWVGAGPISQGLAFQSWQVHWL
jgi:hypothetical protein